MDEAAKARADRLDQRRKQLPGGQIPPGELYQPDPIGKSMQGPMEITPATFATCKIKHGKRS